MLIPRSVSMRVMHYWISIHGGKRMTHDEQHTDIEYYNDIRYMLYINQDNLVVMIDD